RLAVTLRLRHAVVPAYALLRIAPLLMADDHDRLAFETRRSADDRVIVRVHTIAMQLLEVGEDRAHVVERVRPLRMARELRDLPLAQIRKDARRERAAFRTQPCDLFSDVHLRVAGDELQLVDLRFELRDRLLEVEEIHCHRDLSSGLKEAEHSGRVASGQENPAYAPSGP